MADPLLLLYRSDWTQWSLAATVSASRDRRVADQLTDRLAADLRRRSGGMAALTGSFLSAARPAGAHGAAGPERTTQHLLVAPGGRYRFAPVAGRGHGEDEDDESVRLIVSDGQSCWVIRGQDADQSVADRRHPPMSHIVRPTWLMRQLRLSVTGQTEAAGRSALEVRGTPRLPADRWGLFSALLDRVDIVIDAELGLVLRYEAVFDGKLLSSLEVNDLELNPSAAADPASFRPDDDVDVELNEIGPPESHVFWGGGWSGDDGPGDEIDKSRMALNLARGAVYLAARQLARPGPSVTSEPADVADGGAGAEMPAAPLPSPGPAPATPGSRRPVSDTTLRLITHTAMAPLTLAVDVHHWLDAALARRSGPALAAEATSHEGPGTSGFLSADEDRFRLRDSHRTARLTLAMPDHYRIDFERENRPRHPLTMACDGERLRKVYHNRVIASPPLPLPTDFVRLIDPAWLLGDWPLTEAGEQTIGGRRAIQLIADRPPPGRDGRRSPGSDQPAMIAVAIDVELGVVLRQVSYLDGKPVNRYELRDLRILDAVDPAEFGRGIAPDLPELSTNGEPIGDLDLPGAARARSAFGWLTNQARKVAGS